MIDLHTHSIFSDGDLIPTELAQRAFTAGYKTIAITDTKYSLCKDRLGIGLSHFNHMLYLSRG